MGEYCSCGLYGDGDPCSHCSGDIQMFEYEQEEPEIVPCFVCGCQMYLESTEPSGNVCVGCSD